MSKIALAHDYFVNKTIFKGEDAGEMRAGCGWEGNSVWIEIRSIF